MSLHQQLFSPPPPPPPPPPEILRYASKEGWGSIGPVIGVLAVITVLGILAGVIGRLCSGRRVLGLGQYDVEGWIERNCGSCIDGGMGPEEIGRRRSDAPPEPKPSPQN